MSSILALDIGEKRVGVAIAEAPIFLAHPVVTLDAQLLQTELEKLIKERDVATVVVGYPRNQAGEPTAQTQAVESVIKALALPENVELKWQDESLTSVKAEEELESRGKPYQKGDIDALAATFILEDYLKGQR